MDPIFANSETHLRELIAQAMATHGEEVDLNHIEVGAVSDFSGLFEGSPFNGNISQWDVSQGIYADNMFKNSAFEGDLARWDWQALRSADGMFSNSVFDGDLSRWRFHHMSSCEDMFAGSQFNGDIAAWTVGHLRKLRGMFRRSRFAGDLSNWDFMGMPNYSGLVDTSFAGRLPRLRSLPSGVSRTGEYETMLGGGDKLQEYLASQPFNHAHAAFVLEIPGNPMWALPEDRAWLTGLKKTCVAMGLDWNDSVEAILNAYSLRGIGAQPNTFTLPDLGLN